MSTPRGDFDINKVKMSIQMHLNGGSAFNKCVYNVKYGKKKIGECVRGREGKDYINILFLGDEEIDMNTIDKGALADKIKKRLAA